MNFRGSLYYPILLTLLYVIIILSACSGQSATPTPLPSPSPTIVPHETPDPTVTSTPGGSKPSQIQAVEQAIHAVASRTPVPTSTPGPLEREIIRIVDDVGLADQSIFGYSPDVWINLLATILLFTIGYLLVVIVLFRLLAWGVKRTQTEFDDQFLVAFGRELRWLVLLIMARTAVLRLDFWRESQVLFLDDIFFFVVLGVLLLIGIRLSRFAGDWAIENRIPASDRERLMPVVLLFKRLGYLLSILIAVSLTLMHLGVNDAWIAIFLLLVGGIFAFGAREAMGDLISGVLILMDPPYRVGDDILVPETNTWGRVVDIGLRLTRLRTQDNRTVIVPNVQMGKNQIINYSHPQPDYRIYTDISLAYESDMALIREVIEETVRGVEDVVVHKPIDVYFMEFTEVGRAVRVTWWIHNVNDTNKMRDRVNSALEHALEEAGITIAYTTYNVRMLDPDHPERPTPSGRRRKSGGKE